MYGGNTRVSGYWNNQRCAKSGQYICERVRGRYTYRAVARALNGGGGGGYIHRFIDSCSAQRIPFEISWQSVCVATKLKPVVAMLIMILKVTI